MTIKHFFPSDEFRWAYESQEASEPIQHKEPLEFEFVELKQRNYKSRPIWAVGRKTQFLVLLRSRR